MNFPPVALDFDASVGDLPGLVRIALASHQEAIRFGCARSRITALAEILRERMPDQYGTVLMGSGDFHHVSWPLIERQAGNGPLRVVVFDNHPDNMRFPFGVHCGSWVRRVAMLPFVSHVHVVGITSGDIGLAHSWENYLRPLLTGKLTYWSTSVDTSWSKVLGMGNAFRSFRDTRQLLDAFGAMLQQQREPTYLSIDKDVFSREVVQTNWDQGVMLERDVDEVIDALAGSIVGSDITGEISSYAYEARWKRWLSAGDGQDIVVAPADIARWQVDQHALNLRLVARLDAARHR
jgi:hypothetical protein